MFPEFENILMHYLTYSDIGLPGEGAESGLVAAHDPPLGDVTAGGVEAAPVVVGHRAELDVGPPIVVLQSQVEPCLFPEGGRMMGAWV